MVVVVVMDPRAGGGGGPLDFLFRVKSNCKLGTIIYSKLHSQRRSVSEDNHVHHLLQGYLHEGHLSLVRAARFASKHITQQLGLHRDAL